MFVPKTLPVLISVLVLASLLAGVPVLAQSPIATPTRTPAPPTATPIPPTATATSTPIAPTATTAPPTATPVGPTPTASSTTVPSTLVPPTATSVAPVPTSTRVPPTPFPTSTPWVPGQILGYHTVRYGESLFCIGRAYSVLPWGIAAANSINYPYSLRVGQRLAIPNSPWASPSYGPVCARQFGGVTPTPPPSMCRVIYVVRYGDTLYSIAWRYRSSVWIIAMDNHILNPNFIFPGQVLCIR